MNKYLENHNKFIEDIVKEKYLRGNEKTWEDVKLRITNSLPDSCKKKLIIDAIMHDRFIPAGSILASLGVKDCEDSMSNCYYIPLTEDSIEGIYDTNKRLARTFSKRGGSGSSITALRPTGAKVNNAANSSSGAVSFVPLAAKTTETIGQGGRRAALLLDISIRHPDALRFIKMKAHPEQVFPKDTFTGSLPDLSQMNVSIAGTDEFMEAVEQNQLWHFEFPDIEHDKDFYNKNWDGNYEHWEKIGGRLKRYGSMTAREVMDIWAECAHQCGDPGVLWVDRLKDAPAASVNDALVPVGANP